MYIDRCILAGQAAKDLFLLLKWWNGSPFGPHISGEKCNDYIYAAMARNTTYK